MKGLDKKDCIILNILQKNCRSSFTEIGKQVDLSVDSVKKRIQKMEKNNIFHPRIQLRPRFFGFENFINININFNNQSKEEINKFIKYLEKNPRVAEIFRVSGEWDLSIVILAKDAEDRKNTSLEIKNKFGSIINTWNESTTLEVFKFETYDMKKLLGFDKT